MLDYGITYMHEHTIIDLSSVKENEDCNFNNYEQIVKEFKKLYELGVRNIVDVTSEGMGRNISYVNKVAKETNINIIQATGFYQEKFMTDFVKENDVETIAQKMINDITCGINGTNTKASIIAEIATSYNEFTDNEYKVFEAAVIAHKKTGVVISTHTTLGTIGNLQVDFFKKHKVNLNKVIIGHVDLSGDYDYIKSLLETGVNVAFDTIGKNNYQPDELRAELLKKLIDDGYSNKIVLSMDITRKSNLEDLGGIGYAYLLESFIPLLRNHNISEVDINKMLVENPLNIFRKDINEKY